MGANTGSYTRGGDPAAMFDEQNLYLADLQQSGKAAVDADFNDAKFSLVAQLRRIIQMAIGDGSPNNGFKIEESGVSNVNNFTIKGGDGTDEGAGRFFLDGHPCILKSDVERSGTFAVLMEKVNPQVTGVIALVLTDSTANWTVNEHAGKTLTPDVNNPGTTFTITSNTATTITVSAGDLTTATSVGLFYRVELSTPSGGDRTDEVYLDVFLDEVDEVEDTNFVHTDLTPDQAAANRLGLRQFVRVKEGAATPAGHTDLDGRVHFTFRIATLNRLNADTTVTTAMIVDERPTFLPGNSAITVEELDLSPSIAKTKVLRFTNGTVTDLGNGIVAIDTSVSGFEGYLEKHAFNPITASGVFGDLEYPTFGTDFELWHKMRSTVAAGRIDVGFSGRLAPGQAAITEIRVPILGTTGAEYRLKVFAEGSGAAPVFEDGALQAAPLTRLVRTLTSGDLSSQPTGEKRYFVVIEATLDDLEEFRVGSPFVKQE